MANEAEPQINSQSIEMPNEINQGESNNNLPTPNNHPNNHKLRFGLLAILMSGSLLVLGRSLFDSNIGKPTPLLFPERIELTQTKQVEPSQPIIDNQEFFFRPKYLFGQHYKFLVDDQPLDIALRYAVGTEGDIPIFIKVLANIDISESEIRQKIIRKDPIGYYAIFNYQDRAYLTACINPRGISTVTKEQFDDNASDRAMDRDVIISWLLGQKDLRDRRCLWTLISTPLTADHNLKDTNQKLEKIWILWYEWWKPRFPTP